MDTPAPRTQSAKAYYRAFIRETYTRLRPHEQAAQLGLSPHYVMKLRSELIRAGVVDPAERAGPMRPWSDDELVRARLLIEEGKSVAQVARALGRSYHAVVCALQKHEGGVERVRRQELCRVRSLWETAQLFGVSYPRAFVWVRERWLKARRNGAWRHAGPAQRAKTKRVAYLVSDDAIMAFLSVREAWVTYDPADITDAAWRAAAEDARAAAGGFWITAQDYASQAYYAREHGSKLVRQGRVPYETRKILGAWYVWIENDHTVR